MIVLGDAGLNYYGNDRDADRKRFINDFPFVTFCIHGNHDMRPFDIPSYKTKMFCDGGVWYEEEYPNILFANAMASASLASMFSQHMGISCYLT